MSSWPFCCYAQAGLSLATLTRSLGLNCITPQGTEVLQDKVARYETAHVAEGTPRQYTSSRFVRYTGTADVPRWEDEEPGECFTSSGTS